MSNNQKQKKLYTNKGYVGYIYYLNGSKAKVQPTDGSALVECKTKNLNQLNWEGKEPVTFDYFCEEGNIVVKCFPMSRAENPVEGHMYVTKADKENVKNHVDFVGTLEELRELVAAEEKAKAEADAKVAAAEVKVQPAIKEEEKEEVKIPSHSYFSELCEWLKGDPIEMIQFIWKIRDNELTSGDCIVFNNLGLDAYSEKELSPILDNLEKEVESYVYDSGDFTKEEIAEIERKLDSDSSEVEETLPEEEVPEEAYEWEEEELKDYEENLDDEYSEYDDDSFYESEKTFSSHKKNWN